MMNSSVINGNISDTEILSTPLYVYIWVTIGNVFIFIVGFVGNTLVISVVLRFKDMNTSTNYCFVNLSIADLLTLTICQISALTEFFTHDRWLLGDALCKFLFVVNRTWHMITFLNYQTWFWIVIQNVYLIDHEKKWKSTCGSGHTTYHSFYRRPKILIYQYEKKHNKIKTDRSFYFSWRPRIAKVLIVPCMSHI